MTYSVQYSLADNMQRAGMNTLMGIGIVFLMLIFLSLVIGLFKYMPRSRMPVRKKQRGSTKSRSSTCTGNRQSEAADEDCADDLELVAVISAAICSIREYFRRQFCCPFHQEIKCKWHRA